MSLRTPMAVALLTAVLAGPALCQLDHPQFFKVDHSQSTGWVSNTGGTSAVIATLIVEHPAVASVRLQFDQVHLAGSPLDRSGSYLLLTSLQDGHQQIMNAQEIQNWDNGSAWFNGPAVQLDLVAAPGTGTNLVSVGGLEIGIPLAVTQSQCGPTDDRVPSNDPRVARLLPSGCTAWMINDCAKCFLSAGHCGTGNNMVEFNVPFSTSNGSWNHPPPSDQYAIDGASKQANNAFGNDWFYFGTLPNGTTGKTAFEGQGAAFDLVNPPPVSGSSIRITGHGTDSTPNSTYNQVQQTHVGPFTGSGSSLSYQTDTTGGNSGSPVIWEQANAAIGIHTNAGCSTSGSGSNTGTPITVAALQNALANPTGVCASGGFGAALQNLGNGLANTPPFTTVPFFGGCGDLTPNSSYSFSLDLPNLQGNPTVAYLILGGSAVYLPFKGGTLVPSPDTVLPVIVDHTGASGWTLNFSGTWPAGIPAGSETFAHWWIDVDGVFFDVIMASNALKLVAQ